MGLFRSLQSSLVSLARTTQTPKNAVGFPLQPKRNEGLFGPSALLNAPVRVERRAFLSTPALSSGGLRNEDMGALTSVLHKLKDVPKPYPPLMFPSAYLKRDGLPLHEVVTRECASWLGPMVYELRVDVWPSPHYWMIHGIWPAYVWGHWLVYYKLEKLDDYELYLMKETVKQEILNLDIQTRETLSEIWKSYKIFDDACEHEESKLNMDFWAYEKLVHCWDLLNCPKGQYFYLTANLGKQVRNALLNWISRSAYTPNQFYTSESVRIQMEKLFGVKVHLIVKADDDLKYDPMSTRLPFLHGLALMVVKDPMTELDYNLRDHPSGFKKVPQGSFYLLM